jgi:hypothetical protein
MRRSARTAKVATMSEAEDVEEEPADEQGETTTVASRHWLTNDALAYILNFSLIGMLAASAFGYTVQVDGTLLGVYAASLALANIWAFGASAASKLGNMLGGNQG